MSHATVDLSTNVIRFPKESAPVLFPNAPMPSARALIALRYTMFDDGMLMPTLYHAAGDFLAWHGTHYERVAGDAMRAAVWGFLETSKRKHKEGGLIPFQPEPKHVSAVLDALKAATHAGAVGFPQWVGDQDRPPAREMLPCANGLLHLATRRLWPHTPEFLGVNALPYAYQPDAPKPVEWLRFLGSLWGDDRETIAALQEWMGYCLTLDTRQHKMLLLIGPKRSGKGTIARILTAMLGPANVAGPTLGSLGGPFGLAPLLDKQLAIVSDARLGGRADQSLIAERLLSISGEDLVGIDRKHKETVQLRLPVRFMILTNEAPRISDASGALASRFIILECTRSFFGKEDRGLEARLLGELPGILLWALEGLTRLNARERGFVQPASAADILLHMEDLASPVGAFIRDRCEVGPDKQVDRHVLYAEWCQWCKEAGQRPTKAALFVRDLAAAAPGLRRSQPRENGKRGDYHLGVSLRDIPKFDFG